MFSCYETHAIVTREPQKSTEVQSIISQTCQILKVIPSQNSKTQPGITLKILRGERKVNCGSQSFVFHFFFFFRQSCFHQLR